MGTCMFDESTQSKQKFCFWGCLFVSLYVLLINLFLVDNNLLCFCRKLSKIFKSVSFKFQMALMMKG